MTTNDAEITVFNAGVPGSTLVQMQTRLATDVFAHQPDLVVLKAGTNDALNSQCLTAPAAFAEVYADMCATILRHARLVVCTILPYYAPFLSERHAHAAYAGIPPAQRAGHVDAVIRQTAGTLAVPLADLHTVFREVGEIGEAPTSLLRNPANSGARDGVHPTAAGYRLIAAVIYQTVLSAGYANARRIVCLGDSITYGTSVAGAGTPTGETYPAVFHRLLGSHANRAEMRR